MEEEKYMSATSYDIDPAHSSAHFSVRHMMISNVKGEFTKLSGSVTFDSENPGASKVEAVIDVASLHTRDEQRDGHLKSPDFFDVANFGEIRFESTSVKASGDGEHLVTGNLTIHGVTKEVTLKVEGPTPEVKDPWGNIRAGATATTKINRKDFGLVFNVVLDGGGVLVGEDVAISLELEMTKKAA
jgi:polyisoprenoid-binding protein YceI